MTPLRRPVAALVRELPATFDQAIRRSPEPIDVGVARRQHEAYVEALIATGVDVRFLPRLDDHPDSVFVEDTAVIIGGSALLTVPGAETRRGEVPSVAAALAESHSTRAMLLPATLDGGDVLRAGDRLLVGLSARTNQLGLAALEAVAAGAGLSVVAVPVGHGLHLKSSCSLVDDETAVCAETLDPAPLNNIGLTCISVAEPAGANVLALGDTLLVSADAPLTAAELARRGFEVRVLELSELHRADGALTCLSLRIASEGEWCV